MTAKRLIILIALSAIIGLVVGTARANIINVPDDFGSIQEGINYAETGDTVLVEDDSYVERIAFYGKSILVGSRFIIDGDTMHIRNTVIDADTVMLGQADTASVVSFANFEDSLAVLCGFTITNGIGTLFQNRRRGGGIWCFYANPTIKNNIIRMNSSDAGGGIDLYGSHPLIEGNIIDCNNGHGICLGQASSPYITGNTISNNRGEYGAGIQCNVNCNAQIMDNIIASNGGGLWGGGIFCNRADAVITNNIICGNDAYDWGGGICCDEANPVITNNTIVGNTAQSSGGGLFCLNDAQPAIINSIIWGNTAPNVGLRSGGDPAITYSDIAGGWEGEGNIDDDPLFFAASNDFYNVCSESPCLDSGDPTMTDPDGSRSDIGYYYPEHAGCDVGKIICISVYGNDTTGHGSPQNPYRTIQHGIDLSYSGDTILVYEGTYQENLVVYGKTLFLTSNYLFTGDIDDVYNTILDGRQTASVVVIDGAGRPTINGFTIRNGSNWFGGGILSNYSNPLISNNIIFNNSGEGAGGGISCLFGQPIISNNHIDNNQSGSGGGIYGFYCDRLIVRNNIIRENSASNAGGIYASNIGSESVIRNNLITGNHCLIYGGGLSIFGNGGPVINNTFAYNYSDNYGGAICMRYSTSTVVNSILWQDSVASGYNEIYVEGDEDPSFMYSDIMGGHYGEGNLDTDPLFRDAENGDYHLMATQYGFPYDSPCIDTGDPEVLDMVLDSLWGLGTARSDMGAYGGGDTLQVGIPESNPSLPYRMSLKQNYPNPFNARTTIEFELAKTANAVIAVYDILGRQIESWDLGELQAGTHRFSWDGRDLPSGVYFYRVNAGIFKATKKMVLLK